MLKNTFKNKKEEEEIRKRKEKEDKHRHAWDWETFTNCLRQSLFWSCVKSAPFNYHRSVWLKPFLQWNFPDSENILMWVIMRYYDVIAKMHWYSSQILMLLHESSEVSETPNISKCWILCFMTHLLETKEPLGSEGQYDKFPKWKYSTMSL